MYVKKQSTNILVFFNTLYSYENKTIIKLASILYFIVNLIKTNCKAYINYLEL